MNQNAVIYARVSMGKQKDNYSLPTQLSACRDYAAQNGYQVIDEFVDAHTGTSLFRPRFDELKRMAGQVKAVIVYTQDRLGRAETLDMWNLVAELQSKGTDIHCVDTGAINISDTLGQISLLLRAQAAREESRKIGERSQRGKKARARAGKVVINTVAVYGYDYDRAPGMLVINDEQARIVMLIFTWYVIGDENGKRLGTYAIAKKLTALGIPTKFDLAGYRKNKRAYGAWGQSSVQKIIHCETYTGTWYYNRRATGDKRTTRYWKNRADWIPVSVPAIVPCDLFEAAKRIAKEHTNNGPRNTTREYLMRGRLTCGTCGRVMHSKSDYRRREDGLGYYVCHGQEALFSPDGKTCTCNRSLKQADADPRIWAKVVALLRNPSVILKTFDEKQAAKAAAIQPDKDYLARCKAELENVAAKRKRVLHLYAEGKYNQAELDDELKIHEAHRAELEAKIADLESRLAEVEITDVNRKNIEHWCKLASKGIDRFNFEQRIQAMDALAIKGTFHRGTSPDEDLITLTGFLPDTEVNLSTIPDYWYGCSSTVPFSIVVTLGG